MSSKCAMCGDKVPELSHCRLCKNLVCIDCRTTTAEGLIFCIACIAAMQRGEKHYHNPLQGLILKFMRKREQTTVTDLAYYLVGAHMLTPKGKKAYRIVASDNLSRMTSLGLLKQHGKWKKKREDGGPYFTVRRTDG